ncbi:MAG: ACP phosphodiesterase [Stagnimonas sp.]|nr:ACP phosphodiesterase [Stagnimonas sp.]
MNFLAHLWLADQSGTSLAGSVLGDVVHGSDLSAYPAEIAAGVRLHRRIDAATDRHPHMVALRQSYPDGARRYAGIVLDLVADYVLIQQWSRHSAETLEDFCGRCGAAIEAASPWFLLAGGRDSSAREFEHLLRSYGEVAGIDRALRRTATRLRKPELLLQAAEGWLALAAAMQPQLPDLLTDLRRLALESAPPEPMH